MLDDILTSQIEPETQRRQCQGMKIDGSPCGAPPITGQDRCWFHQEGPEAVELRDLARRQGGRRRAYSKQVDGEADVTTLGGLQKLLTEVVENLRCQDATPSVCAQITAAVKAAESLIVSGELEAEIDALLQGKE